METSQNRVAVSRLMGTRRCGYSTGRRNLGTAVAWSERLTSLPGARFAHPTSLLVRTADLTLHGSELPRSHAPEIVKVFTAGRGECG